MAKAPKGKLQGTLRELQLYVWTNFSPDYTEGLACAVAYNQTEAETLIITLRGYPVEYWGTLTVYPLNRPMGFAVSGGG